MSRQEAKWPSSSSHHWKLHISTVFTTKSPLAVSGSLSNVSQASVRPWLRSLSRLRPKWPSPAPILRHSWLQLMKYEFLVDHFQCWKESKIKYINYIKGFLWINVQKFWFESPGTWNQLWITIHKGRPQNFREFWPPSPCPHFDTTYSTKFTLPPYLCLLLG